MEDDALPQERVEQGIAGISEAHHVDFDPGSFAQVRYQGEQVEILAEDGYIRIGVRAASPAGSGTEEEGEADVPASAQRLPQGLDDRIFRSHAGESTAFQAWRSAAPAGADPARPRR